MVFSMVPKRFTEKGTRESTDRDGTDIRIFFFKSQFIISLLFINSFLFSLDSVSLSGS